MKTKPIFSNGRIFRDFFSYRATVKQLFAELNSEEQREFIRKTYANIRQENEIGIDSQD